jgi:hypothetical protein
MSLRAEDFSDFACASEAPVVVACQVGLAQDISAADLPLALWRCRENAARPIDGISRKSK